jgi:glycosyltransferase involved in cell wall biosynthesis
MHVLVIAQLFPPDMGGGGTRAYNVVRGLTSLGHKVTVITAFPHYPNGKIPKEYKGKLLSVERGERLSVFRTWVPPLASIGFIRRLILFASFCISSLFPLPFVGRIDIAWAANPNMFSIFPALFYRRFKGCPVVQNVDDLWPEEIYDLGMLKSPLLRRFAEYVSKFTYVVADAITPISPAYVDVIVNKYKVSPEKLHVVPAGVDLDKFPVHRGDTKRKERNDEFRVCYIGAFSLAYDFDQVLKAAKLLAPFSDVKFAIQGGGELADVLKSKVKRTGIKNVKVVDMIVSREDVARILSESDALLLPLNSVGSVEMGISSKLYEYQAAGKPILCCSNGQPARYVSETESGIVVKPGDHEALAKAIFYLRGNEDFSGKLGASGRQYVENNLSIGKIGLKITKLFESLM